MYMEIRRMDESKMMENIRQGGVIRIVSNIIVQVRLQLDLESYGV